MSARGKKPKVAETDRVVTIMANGIQRAVGWFNGWAASPESERASCKVGARNAITSLRRAGFEIREIPRKRKPTVTRATDAASRVWWADVDRAAKSARVLRDKVKRKRKRT